MAILMDILGRPASASPPAADEDRWSEHRYQEAFMGESEYPYYTSTKIALLQLSETRAKMWDSSSPDRWASISGDTDFLDHLKLIAAPTETQANQDGSPHWTIITATGDPTASWGRLTMSANVLDPMIMKLFPRGDIKTCFQSRLPHIASDVYYDAAGDLPESITISFRCPRNSRVLVGAMSIHLATLSTAAFIAFPTTEDAKFMQERCRDNETLLKIHPLYLLVFIFEERFARWAEWFTGLWKTVAELETATGMTAPGWRSRRMCPERLKELQTTTTLLETLHGAHTEMAHCETVMKYAAKFADVARTAIDQVEESRRRLGLVTLKEGERVELERRLRYVTTRCQAVDDRVYELKERLRGQINVVFSLIARKDSKTSASIADMARQDSRVMRTIGVLTLVFLPSTLVTSIWSANIIKLNPSTNWKIWLVTAVAVTVGVVICWVLYERIAMRRPKQNGSDDSLV